MEICKHTYIYISYNAEYIHTLYIYIYIYVYIALCTVYNIDMRYVYTSRYHRYYICHRYIIDDILYIYTFLSVACIRLANACILSPCTKHLRDLASMEWNGTGYLVHWWQDSSWVLARGGLKSCKVSVTSRIQLVLEGGMPSLPAIKGFLS